MGPQTLVISNKSWCLSCIATRMTLLKKFTLACGTCLLLVLLRHSRDYLGKALSEQLGISLECKGSVLGIDADPFSLAVPPMAHL